MTAGKLAEDRAWLFAALSGPFSPTHALEPYISPDNPERLVMAATRLAEACDTNPAGADGCWLMRTPARHSVLKVLAPAQLNTAIAERRKSDLDAETEDLLAILLDESPLTRSDIMTIIDAHSDQEKLERVIVALDRAGEFAPAKDLLVPARSALAELNRAENRRRVAERGFFGRETECAQIAEWLSFPVDEAPTTCLLVCGGPGIGKSTLLAEAVNRFHEHQNPLVLRLDFDRAGLDVQDQVGLTMEAVRQLAEQLGDAGAELMGARLDAGGSSDQSTRRELSRRQRLPEPLATMLGKSVAATGRTVLVILDTLEILRGRGETYPDTLFTWIDSLVSRGVKPMCVLAAGRGDALDSLQRMDNLRYVGMTPADKPGRVRRIELSGLDDVTAKSLLARLEVPPNLWREVLELAQGNPLKIRLAAEVSRRSGLERLPKRKRGSEVSAGFLYRMLLSRIDDPDLKRLAHPGLIVRSINADLIREVLAPRLGLGRITQERADELLRQLASHHWLVEYDVGAPGFLKHRSDMRRLLLPLLYQSSPKQSARIDAAAMRWFAGIPQVWAQIEAVYHQLQLTRVGERTPSVPVNLAGLFDAEMLEELPSAAADLVRRTRGERTSQFRGSQATSSSWGEDTGFARELLAIIQRQDWSEGAYLVQGILDAGGLDVRSQAADAVRSFLWRTGQWAQARRWLAERDRFSDSDEDLSDLPDALALARLEMRAEFDPEALRRRWRTWRPLIQRFDSTAVSASDDGARHGALALLLANLPEPFHFSSMKSREGDLASAAGERWVSGGGRESKRAEEIGRERLSNVIQWRGQLGEISSGRIFATLTPYAAFLEKLLVVEKQTALHDALESSVRTIASSGALLGGSELELNTPLTGGQIAWLADVGLFAEWAGAVAFATKNENLKLIGRAAERWRRTMAGNWSIGRRRGHWRTLPLLDETLRERLGDLSSGRDPARLAREQLEVWKMAISSDLSVDSLLRHWRRHLPVAHLFSTIHELLDVFTRQLLARGVPAAFAPPLAVLVVHSELRREML